MFLFFTTFCCIFSIFCVSSHKRYQETIRSKIMEDPDLVGQRRKQASYHVTTPNVCFWFSEIESYFICQNLKHFHVYLEYLCLHYSYLSLSLLNIPVDKSKIHFEVINKNLKISLLQKVQTNNFDDRVYNITFYLLTASNFCIK